MSAGIVHITNGDALSERLHELEIDGTILTMRELMMDGPLDSSHGWKGFFKAREAYIYRQFGRDLSYKDYVLSELNKMQQIFNESIVCFWFEDDLFCQANWWFLLDYLKSLSAKKYLVRSGDDSPYSFGHLDNDQLKAALESRLALKEEGLIQLWQVYANNNTEEFNAINNDLKKRYPFIGKAFEAHLERIPKDNHLGKPQEILKELHQKMDKADFGSIFRVFSKQTAIYGYGDLQVRHMLNAIG